VRVRNRQRLLPPSQPVRLKIGTNVDATYDVQIKNFMHEGIQFFGELMLCPYPGLKSRSHV
jgi:hypothetical protein